MRIAHAFLLSLLALPFATTCSAQDDDKRSPEWFRVAIPETVSYTHLTLPTILLV